MTDTLKVGPPETTGDAVVIPVAGEITFANAGVLGRELDRALASGARRIVIDLTGVGFVDSSGLSALLAAGRDAMRDGATVAVVYGGEAPPAIFRFKGVERLVQLHPSRQAALA